MIRSLIIASSLFLFLATSVSAVLNGPPPQSGKQFSLLPPNSTLPSDAECAARVRRTTWEPRPANNDENQYVAIKGTDYTLMHYSGTDYGVYKPGHAEKANALQNRITGNFTGTTDEILQWAACKWGFDEDMARAQAVVESNWEMSANGDNGESFGILQVRKTAQIGTHPASAKSTAFNADYTYGTWRKCYEGLIDYLGEGTNYAAGDAWGCVGTWYTGNWYGTGGGYGGGAQSYIDTVKQRLQERTWQSWQGVQVTSAPTPTTRPSPTGSGTTPTISTGCQKKSQGDANCDGSINLVDFEMWRKEYTRLIATKSGDFNGDGSVGLPDFETWRKNAL